MSRDQMLGLVVTGLFVLCASSAWSSEADELRERAKAIQREAAELAEKGRTEAAEELEREALKFLESAEHLDEAGVHDLAGQLRSKAASMKQELGEQIKRLKEEAVHHVKKDHKATAAEVVELRQLVERLQAEIKELREQAERR